MRNIRLKLITILTIFGFIAIIGQLFDLQVINGQQNRILAEENRLEKLILPAPRGLIFDRNGNVLVDNLPVYVKGETDNRQEIPRNEALKLQVNGDQADLTINLKRNYIYKDTFAHLIGYLGSINMDELIEEKMDLKGYVSNALLGRIGVESQYENTLRGHDGTKVVEVNTQGKSSRVISQVLPSPGKSITLAVDKNLQNIAASLMEGKRGAVIATDPANGEVLVLFSSPSFDPNLFEEKDKIETINRLVNNEDNQPLFDRAISGQYPPGSTFKIVTAVAGLMEGKITPDTKYLDTGVINVGAFSYSNWYYTGYGRTEGEISLARAITRSTDTYFYKVGEWVGEKKLIDWAKKFNLNRTFGIDIPGEVAGFIATPEWKIENRGEPWFLGNTYHMAIGQGDVILTPLGVNLMTTVVANEGKICQPRVLKIGADNTPYQADCRDIGIDKKYLQLINQGMVGACSTGGTGWPLFDFMPQVACKTGTAETGDGKTSHAWITVIAPANRPQIVLTVLVEKGGEGSSVAGPIAKEILTKWFDNQ